VAIPTSLRFATALLAVLAAGCASSSASKPSKRVILSTSYDDAAVGRESSDAVATELGLLDDPALDAYLNEIGRKLLRGIPRRSFNYQFKVVDQEEPNAFALPGGYIFVSRGLLALANDEDELACVLGHEITHAAKRHAAAQQALGRRQNPLAMPWKRAASMAAYGRDMERDADEGGQQLCAAAGYDPMGMSTFLESLEQLERLRRGYSRRPSFFDTHPGTRERAAINAVRAGELRWKRDASLGDPRRALLQRIEGLPVGQRPETGIFQEDRFLHPVLDFQIRFPSGWQQVNTNQAVGAIAPRGEAVIFLAAGPGSGSPQQMAEAWVAKAQETQRLKVTESKHVKVGEIDAWRMRLEQSGQGVRIASYVTFVPYREATWRITGMARAASGDKYLGRTLSAARSFGPLSNEERRAIRALQLHVVEARSGENVFALSKRSRNAWSPADTAVHNGIFVDHRFRGGESVKIVVAIPYAPGVR
jgi:predicted Zn-dependent protease